MFSNRDIRRNVIAAIVCIILEVIGLYIYVNWTKIGETRIVFKSRTETAQIVSDKGGATYGNYRFKLQRIRDEIYVPLNYGSLNNNDTALIKITRWGLVIPYIPWNNEDTVSIIPQSLYEWNNAPKANRENYQNIVFIDYSTTLPYQKRNQNDTILTDTLKTDDNCKQSEVLTHIKSHELINKSIICKVSKSYKVKGNPQPNLNISTITLSTGFSIKPKWYRFEDLSRRIIRIGFHDYRDTISLIRLDFWGPIKIISADIMPDSITMTKMLFFKPNTINALTKSRTIAGSYSTSHSDIHRNYFIEFPYVERIQDARILALTTLMISVLLTLMVNCFIAVGKIVRRENKMNQIRTDAVPCYGSFADCSECSMYDICTFRPDIRGHFRTHRKLYTNKHVGGNNVNKDNN